MSTADPRSAPTPLTHVPFRIGIVGGMGPMAGVFLQQLIIEATPAARDQDHFEVICFTNPHVPERMRSLAEDGGRRYADAVAASAALLEREGATHLVIPCNTAHARLPHIQAAVSVPVINMIELAIEASIGQHGRGACVGLLATTGTLNERVYQEARGAEELRWVLPEPDDQAQVATIIHAVKIGRMAEVRAPFLGVAERLAARGADLIVVGCTELSMIADALEPMTVPRVDPLRLLAQRLVELGRKAEAGIRG